MLEKLKRNAGSQSLCKQRSLNEHGHTYIHGLSTQLQPMHLYYPPAYMPTQHFEWMNSREVTEIHYSTRFEPYFIARTPVPRFNDSFVNRGGNFAQQVLACASCL